MSAGDQLVFIPVSSGVVVLSGDLQAITGINTRFPNLTISGTDKKQQFTNIEIVNLLDLTDRELDVNGNTVYVLSGATGAIIYSQGGYVHTTGNTEGWLNRNMLADSVYVYPLGAINGSFRFRPVVLKPQNNGRTYVQFQHNDPSLDNYWTTQMVNELTSINDQYYHRLKVDIGNNNMVNIEAYPYNHFNDGSFSTMVLWDSSVQQWQKLSSTGPFRVCFQQPTASSER